MAIVKLDTDKRTIEVNGKISAVDIIEMLSEIQLNMIKQMKVQAAEAQKKIYPNIVKPVN